MSVFYPDDRLLLQKLGSGTPSSTTYLRGDQTWATIAGGGDVTKVGTPVNNQVGVWTGDGTIEGDADLTFDGTTLAAAQVTVTDEVYGAGWNGSTQVPTKNAVYDKIETLGGGANVGTTTVDFGAFPGSTETSVAVTGQASIVSGSVVQAWIRPVDTADHLADEHMIEPIAVFAGNIVAATGFTIYARNTSTLFEPNIGDPREQVEPGGAKQPGYFSKGGGIGTTLYGLFTVAWSWT